MVLNPVETIDWPLPSAEPCDEGLIRHPILVCNGMGEWVPDYIAPTENGSGASNEFGRSIQSKPCKCSSDPAALVRLGAELWRDAFAAGVEFAKLK